MGLTIENVRDQFMLLRNYIPSLQNGIDIQKELSRISKINLTK